MARTLDDIERYILSSRIPSEPVGENTWILRDPVWHGAQIVIHVNDPLVVFRCKVLELSENSTDTQLARLFAHLLQLNASQMLQGAYALEGNSVVAVETMQLANLDENEFIAALDSLSLAIGDHRAGVVAAAA